MFPSKRAMRRMLPPKYWPHQGKKEMARRRRQFGFPEPPKEEVLPAVADGPPAETK